MKYLNTVLFLLIFCFVKVAKVDEYSATGHEQFSELRFFHEGNFLLHELPQDFIDSRLSGLKKIFWGTSTEYLYKYEDATYVGDVVFSRSNKTREPFVFDYSLQTVEFNARSISVEGSISLKGTIKTKKVEGNGTVEVEGKYSTESSFQETEKSGMKVTVYPGKKLTLRVAGEAKITSGFSKYYVFWICTKKGAWEVVDVVTSYFELVEENA